MIVSSMLSVLPTLAIITSNLCAKLKHLFGKFCATSVNPDMNLTNETPTHDGTNMSTYTLQVNSKQKELIAKALEKFGQLTIGQTLHEQDYAKKLSVQFEKNKHSTVIDLSSMEIK
jgi:hypothetical protein